ncbi:MAG: phosphopantetheine-binding protein [Sphingobium sp.]
MRAHTPQPVDRPDDIADRMRALLRDVLAIPQTRVDAFDADTPLFGALPELDSMAVATLLTEMEDRFDILIDDEDIDGDTFETFGTLVTFARAKTDA